MPHWVKRAARLRAAGLVVFAAIACSAATATRNASATSATSARPATSDARAPRSPRDASWRTVRVALATKQPVVRLTSDVRWRLYAADGRTELAITQPGERWVLERDGARVSARREDSSPVTLRDSPIIARPLDTDGTISFNGRRWRGEVSVQGSPGGLLVVNRVRMDDYVKGVVPLEIGTSAASDLAAAEAQAVTARSYAYTRLDPARAYDVVATVQDQVYGGATAETVVGDRAVDGTSGLVLLYHGRVVNAPYHSTCGGSTAEPGDVWRSGPEPYLQRVSDQVPGTDRFYCDWAPKYRWTRTYGAAELRQAIARYVQGLPGGERSIGNVRGVTVTSVTPAGRVAALAVETDSRTLTLRGNDMRYALRLPSGEILYSTYFSVSEETGSRGIERLTLRGGGNGHGVGMCQAGAIGRARAGQDFRTILQTYYPGTTVGALD